MLQIFPCASCMGLVSKQLAVLIWLQHFNNGAVLLCIE